MKRLFPYFLIIVFVFLLFRKFFLFGLLPIPADAMVGLYHPFRDLYAATNPNGVAYKNFLITDPVTQQYPWRLLGIQTIKDSQPPIWNPYSFAGEPLFANGQSALLYPLNILLIIFPFYLGWSFLIVLTPLLSMLFMYLFLRNTRLSIGASILGSLTFAVSGVSVAWLEWGTIGHVFLWSPLILLLIDKLFERKNDKIILYGVLLIAAYVFSFFAGHLQTSFYVISFSLLYAFVKAGHLKNYKRLLFILVIFIMSLLCMLIQLVPTWNHILLSARSVDQADWKIAGWFIPWEHLVQFVAPDFFGNPATLNYWGTWNYAEFVGYIGIIPLVFATIAIFFSHTQKKIRFFILCGFLGLLLSLPTEISKLPYVLNIPFISSSQPTRLMIIVDLCLSVLAAYGFDEVMKKKKQHLLVFFLYALTFCSLWIVVMYGVLSPEHKVIAKNNLLFPSMTFLLSVLFLYLYVRVKKEKYKQILIVCIIVITAVDLFRFADKFLPFSSKSYLFPQTKSLSFLMNQSDKNFRIMTTDRRILPPNFSIAYRIQSIDGYDPLYLKNYAQLIAASERGNPNINPPLGFNRIITPHNFESPIIDLLGVKYVLSLLELRSSKLEKVFQEGKTIVYQNKKAFSRAFFVKETKSVSSKQAAINELFANKDNLREIGIVQSANIPSRKWSVGKVDIVSYRDNEVLVDTQNSREGFLVLIDSFYPSWKVYIDKKQSTIYLTDYNFRGVVVPAGSHILQFKAELF